MIFFWGGIELFYEKRNGSRVVAVRKHLAPRVSGNLKSMQVLEFLGGNVAIPRIVKPAESNLTPVGRAYPRAAAAVPHAGPPHISRKHYRLSAESRYGASGGHLRKNALDPHHAVWVAECCLKKMTVNLF